MSISVSEIVSDHDVANVFHGTNFGSSCPRKIIADTLLKLHCDYATGSTAMQCCHELGLIGKTRRLTKRGRYYLFWAYHNKEL